MGIKGRDYDEEISVVEYGNTIEISVETTSPDDDMEDIEKITIDRQSVARLIQLLEPLKQD